MKNHLTQDELTDYIYRTLDDAERESIDQHLLDCPTCRGRLTEQELRQRQISNGLSAAINSAPVPKEMSFAAIAPRLRPRRLFPAPWRGSTVSASLAFTMVGIVLAIVGVWQVWVHGLPAPTRYFGALPTLACFFFMMASFEGYDRAAFAVQPRLVLTVVTTVI